MDFSEIAARHLFEGLSKIEARPCPDQYVGEVTAIEENKVFPVRARLSERPTNRPCVLLVLESPHISEFKEEPAPAKGPTGINIALYLRRVQGLESINGFGLILINAVQYQCSLGFPTKKFRDVVFLDVWESGGRRDFSERLHGLYQPGDKVVNCCTKGSSPNPERQLRVLVQRTIENTLSGVPVLQRNHPSAWHFPANRARDWSSN